MAFCIDKNYLIKTEFLSDRQIYTNLFDSNLPSLHSSLHPTPLSPPLPQAAESADQQQLLELYGVVRPDLPTYSLDDVSKHATPQDRVWVCFNAGVYDITEFIKEHPG